MPDYSVSPERLHALSLDLRRAGDLVRGVGARSDGFDAALGSAAVAHALHETCTRWTRARARVEQGLTALADGAAGLAAAYDAADHDVRRSCAGGVP